MNKYFLFLLFCVTTCHSNNPYEILGVHRSSSSSEIKTAYKQLAKEWHPDKSSDPSASDQFVKINEAYQVLSDSKRRRQFDMYGTTEESSVRDYASRFNGDHSFFRQFHRGPNDGHSFFFDETPFGHQSERHRWDTLTLHTLHHIVRPDSFHKPFLVFIYGDFCYDCMQVKPLWDAAAQYLQSVGVGIYEAHFEQDHRMLAAELGISRIPAFVGVFSGRIVRYRDHEISVVKFKRFLDTCIPRSIVETIQSDGPEFFADSWEKSKPQCILFSHHSEAPLLFKLVAFEYREKVNFGFVDTKQRATVKLQKKFNIKMNELPIVIMMKDDPSVPIEQKRGSSLKHGALRQIVSANLHLTIPRISSQKLFDDLCKPSGSTKRLCVILFARQPTLFNRHLYHLRLLAGNLTNLQFFYVYEDTQKLFAEAFNYADAPTVACSMGDQSYKLLVLHRRRKQIVDYDWFPEGWCAGGEKSMQLTLLLANVGNGNTRLPYERQLTAIIDEHAQTWFWSVVDGAYMGIQYIVDSFDSPNWLTSVGGSVIFVLIIICILSIVIPLSGDWFADREEGLPQHTSPDADQVVLGLRKLCKTTLNDHLLHSPPGRFTVVVFLEATTTDEAATSPITQAFSDVVYNFTSDVNLNFMWLSIADQLTWCAEIMNINKFGEMPAGTVLAMNGARKYLYVFRPNCNIATPTDTDGISAEFIGLDESENDGDSYEHLEHMKKRRAALWLRRKLPRWLEKLCEGMLRDKKRVEDWPKMES